MQKSYSITNVNRNQVLRGGNFLKIYFNKPLTGKYLGMFKLMEEFVWHYIEDKEDFHKIRLSYREYDDKRLALQNFNCCNWTGKYKYGIRIYNYSFMTFNKTEEENRKIYEKNKYLVLFHELGHMVYNINNSHIFDGMNSYELEIKKSGLKCYCFEDMEAENSATDQAKEFMKLTGMLEENNQK
jgi:hypothetical protein